MLNLMEVPTRYSPVRQGSKPFRLACLRHAASVHPEPGSNSSYNEVKDKLAFTFAAQYVVCLKLFQVQTGAIIIF